MTFRNEMRLRLVQLEKKMDRLISLCGNMERLKEQNETLFDKLMARNWGEYSLSPTVVNREGVVERKEVVLSPSFDESSIGEVLSDEDIGQ